MPKATADTAGRRLLAVPAVCVGAAGPAGMGGVAVIAEVSSLIRERSLPYNGTP
ncbi:hypothetical protein GCM10010149_87360 [Nonomuraea roseoviolacea subsp. roseoviolacea]